MKNFKKITILLSALTLSYAIGVLGSCKKEEPTPPPAPNTGDYIFPADDDPIVYRQINDGTGDAFDRYECKEGYYQLEHPGNDTELFYSFSVDQIGLYALYTMNSYTESDGVCIMRYDASGQYIPTDDEGNYVGEEADLVPEKNVYYSKVNCSNRYASQNDLASWRATFGIKSAKATTITVRFVRIGDHVKEPETITSLVYATQLKGRVLNSVIGEYDNTIDSKQAIPVPYDSSFFYDENYTFEVQKLNSTEKETVKGFYRMGTKENPGDVIYVAINSNPSRIFTDAAFTNICYDGGRLSVTVGTDEDGNYLANDYLHFFMNDGGVESAEKDTSKLCYQNCANVDTPAINDNTQVGMHPVNQELYEFLKAYTAAHPPLSQTDATKYADTLWFAPCYYYDDVIFGSSTYPFNLTQDTHTAQWTENFTELHYNIKWVVEDSEITSGKFKLTCTTENAVILYNKINYYVVGGKFVVYDKNGVASTPIDYIEMQADATSGATFSVAYDDGNGQYIPPVEGVTFTIEKL